MKQEIYYAEAETVNTTMDLTQEIEARKNDLNNRTKRIEKAKRSKTQAPLVVIKVPDLKSPRYDYTANERRTTG